MKKIVTLMVTIAIVTSQIGCAGKIQKISMPIDEIQFDKDYKYTVKLRTGQESKSIAGNQLQGKPNQLVLTDASGSKELSVQNISTIDGQSTVRNGSQVLKGLGYGAAIGGGLGIGLGLLFANAFDGHGPDCGPGSPYDCDVTPSEYLGISIASGAIFAGIGSVLGLGIGALIPKYNKVQITPIVSPTTSGVDAGVNVGVKF